MVGDFNFESQIMAFEKAWMADRRPVLADYLPALAVIGTEVRNRLLKELLCIDLEYRWRFANNAPNKGETSWGPLLDEYVREFSELGSLSNLPSALIAEEYRVRHRWGDRPNPTSFLQRFGIDRDDVTEQLQKIDEELRKEAARPRRFLKGSTSQPRRENAESLLSYRDYLLQELMGSGGTGKVYRAREISTGRAVAVKFLKKAFLSDADSVERFVGEARIVTRLRHPGIVAVQGFGMTPQGGYFIVMELIDGLDLAQRLVRGTIRIDDAIQWTAAACAAIACAHSQQIVHCDIKPGNILLDSRGLVHITDFGLAQHLTADMCYNSLVAGTAPFMAPEQISRAWGSITPRTDVFGLGALLHTLLTGQSPVRGRNAADIFSQTVSATPILNPRHLNPAIPEKVAEICLRALAKSPSARYVSAAEMEGEIRHISS